MADVSRPISMLEKGHRFFRLLMRPRIARKIGTLVTEGYLLETGWLRSVEEGAVVDAAGEPVPWTTLPYIDFIGSRLQSTWSVFEYGAGASTLFYAARAGRVVATEHDAAFAGTLRPRLPRNTTLLVHPAGSDEYVSAVDGHGPFDLVSVDGRDRVRCVEAALSVVQPSTVLVLDDAERPDYAGALSQFSAAGYRSVEFWGLPPGGLMRKCTTIFYRDGNVLGL